MEEYLPTGEPYSVLTEAYYGKNDELIKAEELLQKFVNDVNNKGIISKDKDGKVVVTKNPNTYRSHLIGEIEEILKNQFKVAEFHLSLYTALPLGVLFRPPANAFTWGKGFNFFREKTSKVRVEPSNLVIGVNVDIGIIKYYDLTGEELLSLILHEIGHNMSATVFNFLSSFQTFCPPVDIVATFIREKIMPVFTMVNKGIEAVFDKIPGFRQFLQFINTVRMNIVALFPPSIQGILLNPLSLVRAISPRNIFGYAEEKYADSFATAYGYGVPLSRAFQKFQMEKGVKTSQVIQKIPVVNLGYDLYKTTFTFLTGILDEHPQPASRIIAQLKKLKRDADDPSLSPRQRELIKRDIKELENFINNEYLDILGNAKKGKLFSSTWNLISIKVLGGNTDVREILKVMNIEE